MKSNSLYDIEYFQKIKNAQAYKKKRMRRRRLILLGLLVLFIVYLVTPLSRINSVAVENNLRYSLEDIKKMAEIETSQFSLLKPNFIIKRKLEDTKLFTQVKISKKMFGNVTINVDENRLLFSNIENKKVVFYDEQNNRLSFGTQKSALYEGMVPSLSNKVDKNTKNKLVEKLKQLDDSVLSEVSQIVYMPKSYDKEFFRFVMSGKKEVYLNASLDHLVKVGANYHNFANNTKYHCSVIEYIDTENKAIVKKCK